MSCFGQSPTEDLSETAVAVAEEGRDTRVLGDPMDLICTVANSTHNKTSGTAREVLDRMAKRL